MPFEFRPDLPPRPGQQPALRANVRTHRAAFSLALSRPEALRAHVHYNAGRILTYMAWERWPEPLGGGIGLLGRLAGLAAGARSSPAPP